MTTPKPPPPGDGDFILTKRPDAVPMPLLWLKHAYPAQQGDFLVSCPVCGKDVPMAPCAPGILEVLYHNEPDGTPCNGTARRAALVNLDNLRRT